MHRRLLLALVPCAALLACASAPQKPPVTAAAAAAAGKPLLLYVVRRGAHVDVGIAVADVQPPLRPLAAAYADSRYLLFGFGDRGYLLHGGSANTVAALWPGRGLLMLTSLRAPRPEDVFGEENVIRLPVTPQQMSDLQSFVRGTLAAPDAPERVPPGTYPEKGYSAYYQSALRYSALHTCNTWAAEALQSAQLPLDSFGVEFSWQLWHQVLRLQRAVAGVAPSVSVAAAHALRAA
jgi:hypothetical protein